MWFIPGPSANGEENGNDMRSANPQKVEVADFAPKDTEETIPQLLKKVNKVLKERPPSGNLVLYTKRFYSDYWKKPFTNEWQWLDFMESMAICFLKPELFYDWQLSFFPKLKQISKIWQICLICLIFLPIIAKLKKETKLLDPIWSPILVLTQVLIA